MEIDPLDPILHEWKAPGPPPALDARVLAAFRDATRPSPWRALWNARISVPVPALAALLLIAAAAFLTFRSQPLPERPALRIDTGLIALPSGRGCITRLDATGLQPLPDGAARVVDAGVIKQ